MATKTPARRGSKAPARRYQRTTRGQTPPPKGRAGSSRPSAARGSAVSRSSAPARRAPAHPSLSRRIGSFLRSLSGSGSSPSKGRRRNTVARTPMSLDRKLDLVGIGMIFLGLLTLLSLLSSQHNIATGSWLAFLRLAFGWGGYLFPMGLVAVGLWLVLRYIERIPQVAVERVFGLILLFINILAWMHYFSFPADAYALAAAGEGGGYTGGFIHNLLVEYLGLAGAAIALAAWLLIALIMSLDISVVDLFQWLPPLVVRLQDGVQDWMDERRNHRSEAPARSYMPEPRAPRPPENFPAPVPGVSAAGAPRLMPAAPQPRPWVLPSLDQILDEGSDVTYDDDQDRQRARLIEETLKAFGAPVKVIEINRGPAITQFGIEPDFIETRNGRMRVRVGKIASLADDLALALSARAIRVEAPVPGKGYVGIEVPNEQVALVALRDVIESEAFRRLKSPLRFALGQDVAGSAVAADLSAMPHLLIAGQTGSGKSVCVNSLICCLLLHNTPDDLRLIMVDPKRVELTGYNGIPHLLAPVVVEMERVVGALQWVLREMDMRYHKLAQQGARNISEYNARLEARGEKKLPRLVVFIDELADLMMLAPEETERTITRLAQLARATGIHLVIATQRPSVEVVTGIIKANFPARIAFAVASNVDSRVILDQPGAERLLGRGDMLFMAPDSPAPLRLQGAYLSENEIMRLVSYWQSFMPGSSLPAMSAEGPVDSLPAGVPLRQMPMWEEMAPQEEKDALLDEAIDLSRRQGRASISMLQRRLRIGYTRAARLVDTMQEKGIISSEAGPQGFEILDYGPAAPPVGQG